MTLQQSFDLAYSVLVTVSVIAFLHLMLSIFRMANKLLGNKTVMSLSFFHASTPSKMLQVFTCSVGINCSTLKGPFGTVLRCCLQGMSTGRTTVSWGTNIQIILQSWVVFCLFFFQNSHREQDLLIKYFPFARMFKKASLSSICEKANSGNQHINIYTENPLKSHLLIPAPYNLVLLYFRCPITMNDI